MDYGVVGRVVEKAHLAPVAVFALEFERELFSHTLYTKVEVHTLHAHCAVRVNHKFCTRCPVYHFKYVVYANVIATRRNRQLCQLRNSSRDRVGLVFANGAVGCVVRSVVSVHRICENFVQRGDKHERTYLNTGLVGVKDVRVRKVVHLCLDRARFLIKVVEIDKARSLVKVRHCRSTYVHTKLSNEFAVFQPRTLFHDKRGVCLVSKKEVDRQLKFHTLAVELSNSILVALHRCLSDGLKFTAFVTTETMAVRTEVFVVRSPNLERFSTFGKEILERLVPT